MHVSTTESYRRSRSPYACLRYAQGDHKSAMSNVNSRQFGPDAVCRATEHIALEWPICCNDRTYQRCTWPSSTTYSGLKVERQTKQCTLTLAYGDQAGPFEVAGCIGSAAQWPGAGSALMC